MPTPSRRWKRKKPASKPPAPTPKRPLPPSPFPLPSSLFPLPSSTFPLLPFTFYLLPSTFYLPPSTFHLPLPPTPGQTLLSHPVPAATLRPLRKGSAGAVWRGPPAAFGRHLLSPSRAGVKDDLCNAYPFPVVVGVDGLGGVGCGVHLAAPSGGSAAGMDLGAGQGILGRGGRSLLLPPHVSVAECRFGRDSDCV